MASPVQANRGRLYDDAEAFARALEAREDDTVEAMLEAWLDAYWGVRQSLDQFLAMVAAARAAGEEPSPSWATRSDRLNRLLVATATEVDRYATATSTQATAVQVAAITMGAEQAASLVTTAAPGVEATLAVVAPQPLVEALAGFAGDGGTLAGHLRSTLPADTVDAIRQTLNRGLAEGHGIDRMRRAVTRDMQLTRTRAETILRTESLRVYREVHRQTYEANADTLEGWVWHANLDGATCLACWVMNGTLHPVGSTLDGHPRCRCVMVPRTKSWADLGVDLPDRRPKLVEGARILEAQPSDVQCAVMGPAKFQAFRDGMPLEDMVGRRSDALWGTMRYERSLVAIREGRDANWDDWSATRAPGNGSQSR